MTMKLPALVVFGFLAWNCGSAPTIINKEDKTRTPISATGNVGHMINSASDDYAPKMIGANLIYSSGIAVDGKHPKVLRSELFKAEHSGPFANNKPIDEGWKGNIVLLGKQPFPFRGVALNLNEGALDILPKFRYGVFAAERTSGDSGKFQSPLMDLYEVSFDDELEGNDEPKPIQILNDPLAWESQPALSSDGNILYFVSDRSTTSTPARGNQHIYRSEKINGNWSAPRILDAPFTTKGNDVSPYIGPDGYFYFSSDGDPDGMPPPVGLGKRDIFKVKFTNGQLVGNPLRLPAPFNSARDDDFPSMTEDGRTMFVSSNRDGGLGERDIYAFTIPVYIRLRGVVALTTVNDGVRSDEVPFRTTVSVRDNNDPSSVREVATDDLGRYDIDLVEDHSYSVTASKPTCIDYVAPSTTNITAKRNSNSTDTTFFIRDFTAIDSSYSVTLGKGNIPYFMTGYWKLNTPENLSAFEARRRTDPSFDKIVWIEGAEKSIDQRYIDPRRTPDMPLSYKEYSEKVREQLEQKVYEPILRIARTKLSDACLGDKTLIIEVSGYTDTTNIADPGPYWGEDVPGDMARIPAIRSGDIMDDSNMPENQKGNVMLSRLRAYHTMQEIKQHLQKDAQFNKLLGENRIRFVFFGMGKDKADNTSKAFNRRIDITARLD